MNAAIFGIPANKVQMITNVFEWSKGYKPLHWFTNSKSNLAEDEFFNFLEENQINVILASRRFSITLKNGQSDKKRKDKVMKNINSYVV